jgi:hypothetical protein
VQLLEVGPLGGDHRDQRRSGSGPHGGEIRQGRRDRAKTQILEWKKSSIEVNAQYGDVRADDRLADEGGQDRGVVADVNFTIGAVALPDDCGDTLNEVIFAPGVIPFGGGWVNRREHDAGLLVKRRADATC